MSIKFKCKCGRLLLADEGKVGAKIACWACGASMVVPRTGEDEAGGQALSPSEDTRDAEPSTRRISGPSDLPPEGVLEPGGQTIKFPCSCGKRVRATVQQIGRRVGCPRCRSIPRTTSSLSRTRT
jgi:DNA-directed RNA polymerase subunit RPC12/RpoP